MPRDYFAAFTPKPSDSASLAPTFITFVNASGQTLTPPSIAEKYAGTGLYAFNYNATQTVAFVLDGATTGLASTQRYIFGVLDPQDMMGSTLSGVAATLTAQGATLVAYGGTLTAIGTIVGQHSTLLVNLGSTLVGSGNTLLGSGNTLAAVNLIVSANATLMTNLGSTLVAFGDTQTAHGGLFGTTSSSFGSTSVDPTTVFGFLKRAQEYGEGNRSFNKATGAMDYFSRGSSTLLIEKTVSDNSTGTTCI